jgi:hypothetical protein
MSQENLQIVRSIYEAFLEPDSLMVTWDIVLTRG